MYVSRIHQTDLVVTSLIEQTIRSLLLWYVIQWQVTILILKNKCFALHPVNHLFEFNLTFLSTIDICSFDYYQHIPFWLLSTYFLLTTINILPFDYWQHIPFWVLSTYFLLSTINIFHLSTIDIFLFEYYQHVSFWMLLTYFLFITINIFSFDYYRHIDFWLMSPYFFLSTIYIFLFSTIDIYPLEYYRHVYQDVYPISSIAWSTTFIFIVLKSYSL